MTRLYNATPEENAAIDAVFQHLPTTYPDIEFQMSALHEAFRSRIASILEPHLNAFLKSKHPKDLAEYRELAAVVDSTTKNLGLCVSANGKPALLIGELAYPFDKESARFAIIQRAGRRDVERVETTVVAPTLQLMAVPKNVEASLQPLRLHAYPSLRKGR